MKQEYKSEVLFTVAASGIICFLTWLSYFHSCHKTEIQTLIERAERSHAEMTVAIEERNRVHVIERGAEDDAEELALSEHQEVNYVRCHLRPAGMATCYVHTPPNDIEATCRARRSDELLVDGARCRWTNPETMAHP
jgi:hypothetical protein